jgi:lysophospholipase L1-like esterase
MNKVLLVFCLFLSFCSFAVKVAPSDSNFTYTGRFDFSAKKVVSFGYTGAKIKFDFKGEVLSIGLSDWSDGFAEHENYYNIILNGKVIDVVKATAGLKYYKIDLPSNDIFYKIEIFKRTEVACAIGVFHGVKFNVGELRKSINIKRNIEWVGDSFLCGYGNMVSNNPPPNGNPSTGFHAKNENGYESFGAITSRALAANFYSVAISGRGVSRNFDGSTTGVIPSIYELIYPDSLGAKHYYFEINQDLVVIKLSTNDFGPEIQSPAILLDSTSFVKAYLSFIDIVVKHNPEAKIILAIGGGLSDGYPLGLKRLSRCRSWVNVILNESKLAHSNKFAFFEFKTISAPYGEDWHPTIKSQNKMAKEVTPFIKEFMDW